MLAALATVLVVPGGPTVDTLNQFSKRERRRPGHVRAGVEVVERRQTHCRNPELPGRSRRILPIGADGSAHGGRHRHLTHARHVFHIPPGHDAWTEGDEACVLLDFGGLTGYAVPKK